MYPYPPLAYPYGCGHKPKTDLPVGIYPGDPRITHAGPYGDYDEDYDEEDYNEDYDEDYNGDYNYDDDGHDYNDDAENDIATDPQDLRNSKTFPVYRNCPFEHAVDAYCTASWCFIGQVIDDHSFGRPVLLVQDKSGVEIRVAFYFDNNVQFNYKDIQIGSVIAVLYAERHFFLDGTVGLRLEEPEYVKFFRCSLQTLLKINDVVEKETPTSSARRCQECGTEEARKKLFRRCTGCLAISYCGKECQIKSWQKGHKRECKVFKQVDALKRSRDWQYGGRHHRYGFERPEEAKREDNYSFDPMWKNVKPAISKTLEGTFTVTSGELLWGHLQCLAQGIRTTLRDGPTYEDKATPGGTIYTQGWKYRVPAKSGTWKLIKVNGDGGSRMDSWFAYHSSYDPSPLLFLSRDLGWPTRHVQSRLAFVNRYDWGYRSDDVADSPRTFADIDPESGWPAAVERQKRLQSTHKNFDIKKGHPDYEKWERYENMKSYSIFLIDADKGAETLKMLAGASEDTPIRVDRSLFSSESGPAFGCQLKSFAHGDWEYGRLIFDDRESDRFAGEKDLIAFRYDMTEEAEYKLLKRQFGDPVYENV